MLCPARTLIVSRKRSSKRLRGNRENDFFSVSRITLFEYSASLELHFSNPQRPSIFGLRIFSVKRPKVLLSDLQCSTGPLGNRVSASRGEFVSSLRSDRKFHLLRLETKNGRTDGRTDERTSFQSARRGDVFVRRRASPSSIKHAAPSAVKPSNSDQASKQPLFRKHFKT